MAGPPKPEVCTAYGAPIGTNRPRQAQQGNQGTLGSRRRVDLSQRRSLAGPRETAAFCSQFQWLLVIFLFCLLQGKCVNFALMRPHCAPLHCSPKVCAQPSRECFTLNNCCSRYQHSPTMCSRPPSRMQPFISTPTRTVNRATLSLQPP